MTGSGPTERRPIILSLHCACAVAHSEKGGTGEEKKAEAGIKEFSLGPQKKPTN